MTLLFRKTIKTSWKLLDIKTDEWRITVFDFEDKSLLRGPSGRRNRQRFSTHEEGGGGSSNSFPCERQSRRAYPDLGSAGMETPLEDTRGQKKGNQDEEAGTWALV